MLVTHTWYVAAWSSEVCDEPLARVILNEPVVLYRDTQGKAVALRDQCPHRKLPLSLGRIVGDSLECGYHGMTFDPNGACVRIPGQPRMPKGAKVRSFPTHESMGMVWVWMGNVEQADPARCFHLAAYDDPARTLSVGKHVVVACNYQLLTDNLTDPAHVAFVHRSTLGSAAQEEIPVKVERRGECVVVSRWTLDSPPAPIFTAMAGMTGHVDRWQYYYLHCPSICIVDFGSCAVGAIGPDDKRDGEHAVQMYSCIFMTPETESTTHYFYWQSRNFAHGDARLSAKIVEQIEIAFAEDFTILEAQQRSMDRFPATDHVNLAIDAAPTLQRRIVAQLCAAEVEQNAGASAMGHEMLKSN